MSVSLRGSLNDVAVISLKRGENWNECHRRSDQRRIESRGARRCIHLLRLARRENRSEVTKESEGQIVWMGNLKEEWQVGDTGGTGREAQMVQLESNTNAQYYI